MSRYTIPPINPKHEIVVGWDSPMRTFFATVHDKELNRQADGDPEIDPLICWVGSNYDAIKTVEELKQQIASYASLAPEIEEQLRADGQVGAFYILSAVQNWVEQTSRQVQRLQE